MRISFFRIWSLLIIITVYVGCVVMLIIDFPSSSSVLVIFITGIYGAGYPTSMRTKWKAWRVASVQSRKRCVSTGNVKLAELEKRLLKVSGVFSSCW